MISPCGFVTNENICISGTDGVRKNCKGQSCLGKQTENLIKKKKCGQGQKLQVNANMGIRIRMGNNFTEIYLGFRGNNQQKKGILPYLIFMRS